MNTLCLAWLKRRDRARQRPWAYFFITSTLLTGILLIALMISNMGLESTWNHIRSIPLLELSIVTANSTRDTSANPTILPIPTPQDLQ